MKIKGVINIKYLAKGSRGVVYTGRYKEKKVAIKTKNPESEAKKRIENEIIFLQIVNQFGIGPRLLLNGKDYFVYEFQEGKYFEEWMKNKEKSAVVRVLKKLLNQAFVLDELGIDKKEFHRPLKNVIIKRKNTPVLIDFERCSYAERAKNVTQLFQFIMCRKIAKKSAKLISLLKEYKNEQTEKNFEKLIKQLN